MAPAAPRTTAAPTAPVAARRRPLLCAIGLRGFPGVLGGIETHCENLYPRLAALDRGPDIVVLARRPYAGPVARNVGAVRILPIWSLRHKYLETLFHTLLALLYARLFLHPHIVHLHAVGPGFYAPLARLLGFKVLFTHHSPDYLRSKWGAVGRVFLRTGELMATRFANAIVCINAAIHEDLKARFPNAAPRMRMIRNGAPNARSAAASNVLQQLNLAPRKYVLAAGRLESSKGFHDLVRAFRQASPAGLKLVIAGDAYPLDAYARSLLAEADDVVLLPGFLQGADLDALYRSAALFVHPSYVESFSMVILEALAAKIPVLVSDIPANREFALEHEAYFPVGDVDALATALAAGAWRPSRRGDEVLSENDWDLIAHRYADLLQEIS